MEETLRPAPGVNADAYGDKFLPLRKRAEVRNNWLRQRLENVLLEIMERLIFPIQS